MSNSDNVDLHEAWEDQEAKIKKEAIRTRTMGYRADTMIHGMQYFFSRQRQYVDLNPGFVRI